MNDTNYNQFIGIYNNVYPEGYCQYLINQFDQLRNKGCGSDRWNSENAKQTLKDDYFIFLSHNHDISNFDGKNVVDLFFHGLQICFEDYSRKFASLRDSKIRASAMKMQCTEPGSGYHVWHAERHNGGMANRVLVYILYLNSLNSDEGGETEFLYQRQRYSPVENQMIIWPAEFTHTHRGNTVLGNQSKYIVTGWFYYE